MECLAALNLTDAPEEDVNMMEIETTDLRLDTLPTEVLLHILDYLDVKFIVDVVSKVCVKMRHLAENDATWKIRIARRWPGQYPPVPLVNVKRGEPSNESSEQIASTNQNTGLTNDKTDGLVSSNRKPVFSWTEACISREEECRVWSDQEMQCFTIANSHYSSVDCVLTMGTNLVISGSRDRGINIWNTDQLLTNQSSGQLTNQRPCYKLADAHKGWVWSLCSSGHDDIMVSGSWDNTVKFWSVTNSSLQETRKPVTLKVAVLSTDMMDNTVVAGTYDKKVIIMDKREEVKKVTFYRSHTKPVLGVKMTDRLIMSLSEDQSLVVYDRVAGKRMKKVAIPGDSFPLSLSLSPLGNCLYVGDKSGSIHLIDTTFDRFDVLESYRTGGSGKVTSVVSGLGSVLTSSSSGTVSVHHPDRRLTPLATLTNADQCGELAQISYDFTPGRQTLAAGFSNNTVKIWTRTRN